MPGVLAATTSGATRLALAARVDNAGPNTVDWVSISGTLSDGSMPDFSSASTGYGLTGIPTSGNPSGGGWSHYLNDGSGSISLIDSAGNPDNGHARATEGGSTDGVGIALIDPFSAREFSFQEVTFTYAPGSAGFTDTTEFRITFDGGVVPEPSSLALLSLSGLLVLRRSRRF